MKKTTLKSSLLAGIFSILLLFPSFGAIKNSTLTDITKPYLGIYECKEARYGDTDYLERFSYIHLELAEEHKLTLYYREKDGKAQSIEGKYYYDKKKQSLIVYSEDCVFLKREFPLQEGALYVTVRMGNQTLFLHFEQK